MAVSPFPWPVGESPGNPQFAQFKLAAPVCRACSCQKMDIISRRLRCRWWSQQGLCGTKLSPAVVPFRA